MQETVSTPDAKVNNNHKTADEYSYRRRQNYHNILGMQGRILKHLDYPSGRLRDWLDGAQSARGGGKDLKEPFTLYRRYHVTIAQYMGVHGKTQAADEHVVSRCLKRHNKWQRKNDVMVIEIVRSTRKGEATGYIDYLTPIADQAMQLALSDPDWREGPEGMERATVKAVEWAITQFPKYKPDPNDNDDEANADFKRELGLDEYFDMQLRRLTESAEKVVYTIEEQHAAATEAIRWVRKLAREMATLAESLARTQGARRLPNLEKRPHSNRTTVPSSTTPDADAESVDLDTSVSQTETKTPATPSPATSALEVTDEDAEQETLQSDNAPGSREGGPSPVDAELGEGQEEDDLPPLSAMGQAAVEYAQAGYWVVPNHWIVEREGQRMCSCSKGANCGAPGKHPLWDKVLMPHAVLSASNDPVTVRQMWTKWPNANVAWAVGKQFGIMAPDYDGQDGVSLFEEFTERGDIPASAPTQATGGNGRHAVFRYEEIPGLRNWVKPAGSAVDIKGASAPAQIIVEPSSHISGGSYKWLTDWRKPEPMTPGMRAYLSKLVEEVAASRRVKTEGRTIAESGSTPAAEFSGDSNPLGLTYKEGERNNGLRALCCWLRGHVAAGGEELLDAARLRNLTACKPPLEDWEVRKIVAGVASSYPAERKARQ